MIERVVLVRRQSPDWEALARDYRAGSSIDPSRYVPDHEIPGFPSRIDRIIGTWNKKFRIDFFTCRAVLSALSQRNRDLIERSLCFRYDEIEAIMTFGKQAMSVLFFHDDDDFFAPDILDSLNSVTWSGDVCVLPLFRVHTDLFTFVRDGAATDYLWGRRKSFDFRFQTNNYGIRSRVWSDVLLRGMKDHVEASRYADEVGLTEDVLAFPASATVKTPCAASMLPGLVENERAYRREIQAFANRFRNPDIADSYDWLKKPLTSIAELFDAVANGRRYESIAHLVR